MSNKDTQTIYRQISLNKRGKANYQKPPLHKRAGYFVASAVIFGISTYAVAKGVGHAVDAGWFHSWADLVGQTNPIGETAMHGFADFAKDAVDGLSWFKDAALDSAGDVVEVLKHPAEAYNKLTHPETWMSKKVGLWAVVSTVTGSVTAAVFHRDGHKKDEEQALEQMRKKDGLKAMVLAAPRALWKHRMKAGIVAATAVSAVLANHVPVNTMLHALNDNWPYMCGAVAAVGLVNWLTRTIPPSSAEELNRGPDNVPRPDEGATIKSICAKDVAWATAHQNNNRGKKTR